MKHLWILLSLLPLTVAVLGHPPSITYFDGNDGIHQCATRLERKVTGYSGIIYSHSLYGRAPYNASRNCFMMIVAPAGYRIRLRAIEFDVNGHISNCDKDTLHVFDHETTLEVNQPLRSSLDDVTSPGPIIGQFCGGITNRSELSTSTHNAMTLWWHSNPVLPLNHHAAGFKLLWTAYRDSSSGPCSPTREFKCNDNDCIPIELACDHYADCKDDSDLLPKARTTAQCENLDLDPITNLTGAYLLLVSGAMVIATLCLCGGLIICCRACRSSKGPVKDVETMPRPPNPPQFFPPSPPKIPPPSTVTAFTPRRQLHFEVPAMTHDGYRTVRVANEYGSPIDCQQNEYTYVRNDVHRNLI